MLFVLIHMSKYLEYKFVDLRDGARRAGTLRLLVRTHVHVLNCWSVGLLHNEENVLQPQTVANFGSEFNA